MPTSHSPHGHPAPPGRTPDNAWPSSDPFSAPRLKPSGRYSIQDTVTTLLLLCTATLAFANGANDNTKGVATLYGSGVLSFRGALALATLTTAAGSILSIFLAMGLARAFSAKGLIPDSLLTPTFLAAVGSAAAVSVLAATRLGMAISTTHVSAGGIVGIGGASGTLRWGTTTQVLSAWLTTLPVAAALGAGIMWGLS